MSVPQRRRLTSIVCIVVLVGLLALLRVLWLDSDAYTGLTWNSELVTDEAFYCHDARNLLLTGSIHVVGDNFHNSLITPLLHLIQVGVFRVFGFSLVASRWISVCFSFATLALFYASCRRAFGNRTALTALVLLGFDHINLLYNRMALMDTPAQFFLVACFYSFIRAFPAAPNINATNSAANNAPLRNSNAAWLTVCGLMLIAAYAIRGLSALLLPTLVFLCWPKRQGEINGSAEDAIMSEGEINCAPTNVYLKWSPLTGLLLGLGIGLVVYLGTWYLPNYAALKTVNHFYVGQQLMPHSLTEIRHNIGHSLFGNERGFSAYLFRHSPMQWTLALAWLLAWPQLRLRLKASNDQSAGNHAQAIRFLMLWMGIMLTTFALVRYSPPRYYVLFYPAMAALAALAFAHVGEAAAILAASRARRTLLGTFLVYHLAEAVLRHRNIGAEALLYGLTIAAAFLLWRYRANPFASLPTQPIEDPIPQEPITSGVNTQIATASTEPVAADLTNRQNSLAGSSRFLSQNLRAPSLLPVAIMLLWAVVNGGWLLDWAGHIRHTQRDCDQWLQQHLPTNAVLIGDAAPGLTLRSHITDVPVIPGLCNDSRPLEAFANRPCYIIVFESPYPLGWWSKRYPQWITPQHCLHHFVLFGKFRLALYEAQPPQR